MNAKIIAIAVVAIVAVGGIGAAVALGFSNDDAKITIVDGSGKTIKLDSALENVAVINKNVPRVMMMYGVETTISCFYWGTSSVDEFKSIEDRATNLGTYYTPSVETLLQKKVQAVICPVSSMTLYASYQKSCEDVGITVIRLDCNGSTMFDDMKKMSKIFGEPEKATAKISEYETNYNKIIDAINAKIDSTSATKPDFMFAGAGQLYGVYNTSSAASSNFEQVFGKNITSYTDLSTKGVTNSFDSTNTIEVIQEVQDKVQLLVVRPGASDVAISAYDTAYGKIVKGDGSKPLTQSATAVKNDKAFVMNSNICSGLFMPIGLLMLSEEIYGDISVELSFGDTTKTYTGLSEITTLINDFQESYKQSTLKPGNVILAQYVHDSYSGTAVVTL